MTAWEFNVEVDMQGHLPAASAEIESIIERAATDALSKRYDADALEVNVEEA